MIVGLQISTIIFSFIMIYFALIHYKKGTINSYEIVSWTIIWTLTIFIIMFPDVIRVFANTFFYTRLFDLMVAGGFILVITIAAKSYITTKKLEKKLEEMVRKNAIFEMKKKKK